MRTIITVENLSKKYTIGHQKQGEYQTFRDTLSSGVKSVYQRLRHPLSPDPEKIETEEFWALKDINFEVKQGDRIGIIGRNGAGKSTLLKILSRITHLTTGKIHIKGRIASLLEVGTGFHPELTGRENIFLNGAILGMTKNDIKLRFDEIVAFAEIEKFLDTPVKRYSSGMYVRLAFAVAAHLEPEILLVDEVLAVGDAQFQKKCLGKMGDMSKGGRTVLFVSHNIAAVNLLCKKAILLERGSIIQIGRTADVTESYISTQNSYKSNKKEWYVVDLNTLYKQQIEGFSIKEIDLLTSSDDHTNTYGIKTNDSMTIRIRYSANRDFTAPAFVVSLKDHLGQELIRLSTMPISGYHISKIYNNGTICLSIDSLPFVAGIYFIDIGFVRERVEWLLKLENIVKFSILPQDVYGSGFMLDRTRGMIVLKHQWSHESYE